MRHRSVWGDQVSTLRTFLPFLAPARDGVFDKVACRLAHQSRLHSGLLSRRTACTLLDWVLSNAGFDLGEAPEQTNLIRSGSHAPSARETPAKDTLSDGQIMTAKEKIGFRLSLV